MTLELPHIAEYGSELAKENLSKETLIAVATATSPGLMGGKKVSLYHVTRGYVPAGSAMRLQASEAWGYRWSDGSSNQGCRYSNKKQAIEKFSSLTA